MKKPVAVTGTLLMDQRFWGGVCEAKGVGPAPVHIGNFTDHCVEFVNGAFGEDSELAANARALDFGDEANDGVRANVEAFAKLIETGAAQPPPLVPMAHASLGDKVHNIARVSINLGTSAIHGIENAPKKLRESISGHGRDEMRQTRDSDRDLRDSWQTAEASERQSGDDGEVCDDRPACARSHIT